MSWMVTLGLNRIPRLLRWFICAAVLVTSPAFAQTAPLEKASTGTLKPGDRISLWVWRVQELTGDLPVPETGIVVFPLIGARQVTNVDKAMLRDSLIQALSAYLQTPSIEIRFLRRISIVGAVRQPGVFHIDDTHSVSDALALAGGTTPDGKADQVQLFRGSEKLVGSITRRTRIADLPLESGDQLYVPQRAWLDRNTGIVATLISGVVSVGIALLAR